jgi:hypothetical protein
MTDSTKDPLTQDAWEWIIGTLDEQIDEADDFELLEPPVVNKVHELIEALGRLRYNYMAMTMITVERQNL